MTVLGPGREARLHMSSVGWEPHNNMNNQNGSKVINSVTSWEGPGG